MSKRPIQLDSSKLTLGDWEVIETLQDGKASVKAAVEIIVRCSDWTADEIRALPAASLKDIFEAISVALGEEIKQKN